jgi:Uma2 family endonuclease
MQAYHSHMKPKPLQLSAAQYLSPSTASVDRREKRTSYTTLISLREYIIVEQDRMRELYRRESRGWEGYILSQSDDIVELSCLVLRLTLSEIYEGVELPSGVVEPEPEEYAV